MTSIDSYVTSEQGIAVHHGPNLLLTACPGSGKTRSIAARLALRVDEGIPFAALSYTNVGVSAISSALGNDLGRSLPSSSFLGTIHSFLLRYVLNPFSPIINDGVRLRVFQEEPRTAPKVGIPGESVPFSLWSFTFSSQNQLVLRYKPLYFRGDVEDLCLRANEPVRAKKQVLRRRGIISSDDAMVYALHILRTLPAAGRAISNRFAEIVVDEAQDTSDVQLVLRV